MLAAREDLVESSHIYAETEGLTVIIEVERWSFLQLILRRIVETWAG